MSRTFELEQSSTSEPSYAERFGPLSIPGQLISVKVQGGESFHIHKEVLVKHSSYFRNALDRPFTEGQTNSIDLDDTTSNDFGLYVSVMYPSALCTEKLLLRDIWPIDQPGPSAYHPWPLILRLWMMGDRFKNERITDIATFELHAKILEHSIEDWRMIYEAESDADLKARMLGLQSAFQFCNDNGLKFKQWFVAAAKNAPPQVFAELVDELKGIFKSKVTKAFALRFADYEAIARKRISSESWEREDQGKKLKIEE